MMRRICFLLINLWVFVFFLTGNMIGEAAAKKVAVTGFNNEARSQYGLIACNHLNHEVLAGLVQNKNYQIVERSSLDKVFKELGLQNSGVVDPNTAIEIGNLSGSDYILLGSVVSADVMKFDNIVYSGIKAKVKFALRLVDNKSGSILVSEIVEGTKSEMGDYANPENLLNGASKEAAEKVLDKINQINPLTGTILTVSDNTVYFDLGSDDGVRVGDIYTVYKEGKLLVHPVTGEILGVEERIVGKVKVNDVKPNYAVAEMKKGSDLIKTGNKIKR